MARDTTKTTGSQGLPKTGSFADSTSSFAESASSTASEALDTASSTIKDGVTRARDEAARQGSAALEGITEGVQALGGQAKDRAANYVDSGVHAVTQHLHDFAQAVRKASDELSQKDQTMAAQIVRQAAGGLESLSRSVNGTSIDDIITSVRRFGRNNPAAFIGGAVLAGLALGRFARASGSNADDDWNQGRYQGQGGYQGGQGGYQGGQGPDSWRNDGQYRGGEDWSGRSGGNEGISPRPYSGSAASRGGSSAYPSSGSSVGGAPSQSQGYAGGGMSKDQYSTSGPSSETDESVASSSSSTGGLGSSSISAGGNS